MGRTLCYFLFIACLFESCQSNNGDGLETPPPPLSYDNRKTFDSLCNIIKEDTYNDLRKGKLQLVYKDTLHYRKQYLIFEDVINNKFKLHYNSRYQLDFEKCIAPIMDSALSSLYGKRAKDSLIKLAYHITDSIYSAKYKRGEEAE